MIGMIRLEDKTYFFDWDDQERHERDWKTVFFDWDDQGQKEDCKMKEIEDKMEAKGRA